VPGPLGLTPTSGRIVSQRGPLGVASRPPTYLTNRGPLTGNACLPESSHKSEIKEDLKSELALDIGQLILDITGILDPTPISDGTNALLSLARGRWFDAGINAVSIVPFLGDLAKSAKLPHYLETIHKAVRIAKTDRKWADVLRKLFLKLKIVLDKGLKAAADKLPDAATRQLKALQEAVDDFLLPGGGMRKIPSKADLGGGADAAGSSSKLSSSMDTSPSGVDSVVYSPSQLFGESADGVETSLPASTGISKAQRSPKLQNGSTTGENLSSQSQAPKQSSGKTPSHPDGKSPQKADSKNSNRPNKSDQSNNTNSPNDPDNKNVNKASSKDVPKSGPIKGIKNFDGLEVRGVKDLSHVDESTLRAMQQHGFAAKTSKGDKIVLHHHKQNPEGFIVEIPAKNHKISNTAQHPYGNTKGAGLTPEQRAGFNEWRTNYWKNRATEELGRRGL
jgi:hypothetical protein